MKKTLALMAGCALCVSAAMAAVQGNNTAVIVKKAVVETTTGYQFLCIPVRGFDITGQGSVKGLSLDEILPPSTEGFVVTQDETKGTYIIVQGNKDAGGTLADGEYVIKTQDGAAKWVLDSNDTAAEGTVVNGACVWLCTAKNSAATTDAMNNILAALGYAAAPAATTATDAPTEVLFVGEKPESLAEGAYLIASVELGMNAYGNNTAEAVSIAQIADPQAGDQLMRIQEGSNEYQVYFYRGTKWFAEKTGPITDTSTVTIAPGEAFYYYRAESVN